MRKILFTAVILSALVVTACSDATSPTALRTDADAALQDRAGYIVTFRNGVSDAPGLARSLAATHGGELGYVYTSALRGFSGRFTAQAASALQRNPNVADVELDGVMTASETQAGATWGLDRVDQRDLPLGGSYVYNADGAGTHSYIIDTGILLAHTEFGGRASLGADYVGGRGAGSDCNGHGTHVAGTVGGSTYGVAKNTHLYAVRVLDCRGSGSTSGVIAGVDWVAANHVSPAVANMSLGGGASSSLDAAVAGAVSAGVTMVVAAGNSNANACNYSPAREPSAITVGATTSSDARASYSNYGNCLDIFAPGSSITSAWHSNPTSTNTISGTSMASPHVAGAAALFLQASPNATPVQVANSLITNSTANKVTSAGSGSVNRLLFTGNYGGGVTPGGGGGDPEPPTVTAPSGLTADANVNSKNGRVSVDLAWTSGGAAAFDVYRDGNVIATTTSSTYRDNLGRVSGSSTYMVCNAGTSDCTTGVTASY